MPAWKTAMQRFYGGAWYPVCAVCIVLIGHATGWDVPMLILLLLSMIPALLVCRDIRFAAMPVLASIFTVSAGDYSPDNTGYEERFLTPAVLIPAVIVAILFLAALVLFCVQNRKDAQLPPKNAMLWGAVVFCVGLLANGLFSRNYTPKNLLFAALIVVTYFGVYLLFACYLKKSPATPDYLMYCFLLAGALICAELLWAYATRVQFVDGEIVKGSVVLGWGVWTTVGGMLAFLLPVSFYFAASHKHGWIAYLFGLFEFFCILLSQSRGALLFGAAALSLCLLYLMCKGENRKKNRIYTLCLVGVGLIGVILLRDKLLGLLNNFLEFGFADNGRFEIWQIGWNHFLENPLFGSGFYDSYTTVEWERGFDPYLYHNTLIQLLGACGMVGFFAYAFHRVQTVRLVIKRPTPCKIFLGIALLTLLGYSLLDVLFFKLYPTFFYGLMLLCMQIDETIKYKRV